MSKTFDQFLSEAKGEFELEDWLKSILKKNPDKYLYVKEYSLSTLARMPSERETIEIAVTKRKSAEILGFDRNKTLFVGWLK